MCPNFTKSLNSSTKVLCKRILCLNSKKSQNFFLTQNFKRYSHNFLTKEMYPQAMYPTHKHIIKSNEGLGSPYHQKKDFQDFRNLIFDQLGNESIAIIPANEKSLMTNDIPYTFRQDSDFFMAVGLHEPNGCLVLEKMKDGSKQEYLFLKDRDENTERWDGPTLGIERAKKDLGFYGTVSSVEELSSFLYDRLLKTKSSIFVQWKNGNGNVHDRIRTIVSSFTSNEDFRSRIMTLDHYLNNVKMYKSETDINMLKRAASISAHAIKQAMKNTKPGMSEAHIEAILEFESRLKGAQRLAYPPVIASGSNSIVLHYVANNQLLKDGDLLLIDAGCEYFLYPSDISRSWPINGKFSLSQRKLYTAILNAQKKLIEMCEPNTYSLEELHVISMDLLAEEMIKYGIVNGVSKSLVKKNMNAFCPHMLGHPLGIDIHQNFDLNKKFEPGMVITIEPGLYIAARNTSPKDEAVHDKLGVPEEFRGLGIRIEDNILITENGHYNLTHETPKEIDEIEAIMQEGKDSYVDRIEII